MSDARGFLAATLPQQRYEALERYVDYLATEGQTRGLMGPREVPRLWERHIVNCANLAAVVPPDARTMADVGSGGGLPGLVVALLCPELSVTLIESMARRCAFLRDACEHIGVSDRVSVVRDRAENVAGTFDVVTARAVAPLERLVGWVEPLMGGEALLLKGERASDEISDAAAALSTAGLVADVMDAALADGLLSSTVVRLRRADRG